MKSLNFIFLGTNKTETPLPDCSWVEKIPKKSITREKSSGEMLALEFGDSKCFSDPEPDGSRYQNQDKLTGAAVGRLWQDIRG